MPYREKCAVDSGLIDALCHTFNRLPSRRDVLRGFVGSGVGLGSLQLGAEAKNKHHKKHKKKPPQIPPPTPCTPKCGRKRCGDDGCGGSCGSCPSGQFCRSGTCCTPKPTEVTCTVNCGFADCPKRCDTVSTIGSCGQPVACSCPNVHECLSNGSCGQLCQDENDCISESSDCFSCTASSEGTKHCRSSSVTCSEPVCTSTSDCPVGTQCQVSGCFPVDQLRCVRLSFCPR